MSKFCCTEAHITDTLGPANLSELKRFHTLEAYNYGTAYVWFLQSSPYVLIMESIKLMLKSVKLFVLQQSTLIPGLSINVVVEFKPAKWQYYYDCVRIHCQVS